MTSNTQKWFADNQANWDSRAQAHMFGYYDGKDELLADPHAISRDLARDIHRFGSLTGKDVCHLQCHVGIDTIGFARRGANHVVGLDFSSTSVTSVLSRSAWLPRFVHNLDRQKGADGYGG